MIQYMMNMINTSEDENISEIETYDHYGEKIHETEESIGSSCKRNICYGFFL